MVRHIQDFFLQDEETKGKLSKRVLQNALVMKILNVCDSQDDSEEEGEILEEEIPIIDLQ